MWKSEKISPEKSFFRVKIWSFGVESQPNFRVWVRKNAFFFALGPKGQASKGGPRLSDFRAGELQNERKIWKKSRIFRKIRRNSNSWRYSNARPDHAELAPHDLVVCSKLSSAMRSYGENGTAVCDSIRKQFNMRLGSGRRLKLHRTYNPGFL